MNQLNAMLAAASAAIASPSAYAGVLLVTAFVTSLHAFRCGGTDLLPFCKNVWPLFEKTRSFAIVTFSGRAGTLWIAAVVAGFGTHVSGRAVRISELAFSLVFLFVLRTGALKRISCTLV